MSFTEEYIALDIPIPSIIINNENEIYKENKQNYIEAVDFDTTNCYCCNSIFIKLKYIFFDC